LWRAPLILPQKSILDLRIDPVKPLLGALSLLAVRFHLSLELRNAILGCSKLVRKPLRRIDCMSAVLLGDISSFAQKLQDCLTGFVELTIFVSLALGPCEWNYFGTHVDTLSLSTFAEYMARPPPEYGTL
jgi:hypothetical protein